MALGDAFQDSTDKTLEVMTTLPVEPEKAKPKHSAWSVIPRAVAAAGAELTGNALDIASAYGQTVAATGAMANPMLPDDAAIRKERLDAYDKLKTEGIDWRTKEAQPAYDFSRDLRPDPLAAGAAENIVFGLTNGLTKAIGSGLLIGPVGGAGVFGTSEGMTTAEDLATQGVDQATRTKVGAVVGAVNAAGMALPVAGSTLAQTAGLVAVGGPLSFMAQQQASRSILEGADYGAIAQQFDPLDPVGLALSTLLPAGFATWAKWGAFSGKPAAKVATQEHVDAAMVHNLTMARDASEATRATVPAAPRTADQIPRSKNLSELDRQIETRLADKISGDYPKAVAEYNALPDSMGGKVLNVDTARELSPDYTTSKESRSLLSAAVHEPASKFIKWLYEDKLANLPPNSTVMFTSGGTGAGKSTAIHHVPEASAAQDRAAIVYDTNMNGIKSALDKIEKALAAGAKIEIVHVQRDPVEALVNGALPRAMRMGRAVPLAAHEDTHIGAAETVAKVAEHYKNDPRVSVSVLDNTNGRNAAKASNLEFVKRFDYNGLRERLKQALDKEYQDGRISDAIYRGTLGNTAEQGVVRAADQAGIPDRLSQRDRGRVADPNGSRGQAGLPGENPQGSESAHRQALSTKAFPVQGSESTAVTERGATIRTKYVAVEADRLITSHDNALKPNPEFPKDLQPRDRARAASEAQISKIENGINPELLAESPKASDGAPIIGTDKVVESGNARTIALRRAYETGKADAYRQWLIDNADRFGMDAKALAKMKRPVLARVGLDEYDRAEFARQANESAVAQMSVTEVAKSDAARIPDLMGLVANEDGTISISASMPFIRSFMDRAVSQAEQGAMVTADGGLSQQGLQRIRNAVFAKAYGDPEIVAMMAESTDANIKNVLGGMLRAAPAVARLQDLIAAGARQPIDVTGNLVQAVRLFSKLRADGMTVEQFVAQRSLFDSGISPEVQNLLVGLQESARAPKRIAEMIGRIVEVVDAMGDPRQSNMFDLPSPKAQDVFADAVEMQRASDTVPQNADMFAAADQVKDPTVSSVLSRAEALKAEQPDMPVAIREDGAVAKFADELDAIRRQAKEGTDAELGAQDAPLLKVAAECFLSMGAAAA